MLWLHRSDTAVIDACPATVNPIVLRTQSNWPDICGIIIKDEDIPIPTYTGMGERGILQACMYDSHVGVVVVCCSVVVVWCSAHTPHTPHTDVSNTAVLLCFPIIRLIRMINLINYFDGGVVVVW